MPHPDLEPPARRRQGGAWPRGLAGMIVLVAAIEASVEARRGTWSSPTAAGFEWAHRSATAEARAADVVTLGDSVLKFGFAPKVFERATGRRADNWSTVGNPPAVALSLLRAHFRAGGKPRAIFVDFKPLLLDQGDRPDLDAWARVATFADALELAFTTRDPDYAAGFALAWIFPSVRNRPAIRLEILGRLGGYPAPDPAPAAARERGWRINRGGQLLPPDPRAATVAEFANEKPNLRPGWSCRPGNLASIASFFDLAARHDVPVYWVLTPIHPRLQGARDALGLDATFTRFVGEQARRAPGRVTVVDARRLGLGPDRFVDATHLDGRGAVDFTAALAAWFAALDPSRPGPRWVQLPPSLARSPGPNPEACTLAR